jgi:hypothetical protein
MMMKKAVKPEALTPQQEKLMPTVWAKLTGLSDERTYDSLAAERSALACALEQHPSLKPAIVAYTEALQVGGMNDAGKARMAADEALQSIANVDGNPQYSYMERLGILRAVHADALQARKDGIARNLVKQVVERHHGR